ncbi:MAG: hypothetical protein PQ975_08420 [Methanobacterium sp.]|jgi:hypothetical protein
MNYTKFLIKNIKLIFSKKGFEMAFGSSKVDSKDKLKSSLLGAIYFTVLSFILTYLFVGVLTGLEFLPFFFAFCTLPGMIIVDYYWGLAEKYKDDNTKNLVAFMLTVAPFFFLTGIAFGITTNNIPFGIGFGISTVYPILFMFKRIKTFSDKNVPKYEGPKMSIPLGPGYFPFGYWLLSALLGFQTTGRGFSALYFYFTKGSPSLEFCLVSILVGLVVQSIILFPDKLNKIVPIDLRTRNGFGFMFVLTIVLFLVSCFVMGLFNPEFRLVLW